MLRSLLPPETVAALRLVGRERLASRVVEALSNGEKVLASVYRQERGGLAATEPLVDATLPTPDDESHLLARSVNVGYPPGRPLLYLLATRDELITPKTLRTYLRQPDNPALLLLGADAFSLFHKHPYHVLTEDDHQVELLLLAGAQPNWDAIPRHPLQSRTWLSETYRPDEIDEAVAAMNDSSPATKAWLLQRTGLLARYETTTFAGLERAVAGLPTPLERAARALAPIARDYFTF